MRGASEELPRPQHDSSDQKTLVRLVKAATALHDAGVKAPRKPRPAAKNPKANSQFSTFTYSKKKEYVEWLTEAKTEATRLRRLETAIEWIAEGKGRNWKYQNC